jgi:hypothetical protein
MSNTYDVESIVSVRVDFDGVELVYEVKWHGFRDDENTYEPEDSFDRDSNSPVLATFKREHRDEVEACETQLAEYLAMLTRLDKNESASSLHHSAKKSQKRNKEDDDDDGDDDYQVAAKRHRR